MLLKLLRLLFSTIIGKIPEEKKKEYLDRFESLIEEASKAAAKGAVEGMKK